MTIETAVSDHLRDHPTERAVPDDAPALVPDAPGPVAESAGCIAGDLDDLFETARRRVRGGEKPLATPWGSVNEALSGGLWPGMYCLVGGTGTGKTQWAVQLAVHAACAGSRVLYLALELSRRELAARIVGNVAEVSWSDLLYGRLDETRVEKVIAQSERQVRALPLHVECAPPYGYGADTLAQRARELRPALVVLDYLQLCGGRPGEEPRLTASRVSYVARGLACELDAVVLVLSSTARANYESLVRSPSRDATDFVGLAKESGEIEYAADGVFVLTRQGKKRDGRLLVVAKHRHAALKGDAEMRWTGTGFLASAAGKVRC